VSDFAEMGKKTVFRRLSKWLPLSSEFRDALEKDADQLEDQRVQNAVKVQFASVQTVQEALPEPEPVCDNDGGAQ
jgi:recombinational DNA repair protein RecT